MWPKKPQILLAALLMACLALTAWARHQIHLQPVDKSLQLKDVIMVPPGAVLRQIDLGWHSLAADLLFIRANLYYGHHMVTDEQMPWMSDFISILLDLDPDFKKVYLWGAMVTTHFQRQISSVPKELVMRANRILDAGMKRYPDDYRFPMRIAFNLYYELGDSRGAIPFFEQAGNLPGAPEDLREKLVDLYTQKGRLEFARQTLQQLIAENADSSLSKSLRDRLVHLMPEDERQAIINWQEQLHQKWQAKFAFIPLDLFLLVQEENE